jgi:hypothetical protein
MQVSDSIQMRLKVVFRSFKDQLVEALYEEAKIEMNEAKAICPYKTGALHDSGTVEYPVISGDNVSCALHFGSSGKSNRYAVFVHENLDADHAPPTQAKFLEATLKASAPYMNKRIAKRIDFSKL